MKYKIFVFCVIIISNLSCSTNRVNYKLINDFMSDPKAIEKFKLTNTLNNKSDSIYISKDLIDISKIKMYSLEWETINLQNPFYMGLKVIWNDSNNKISLKQKEISYFRNQMDKGEELIWDQKKFNSKKIVIVNTEDLNKNKKNKYFYNGQNKLIPIHHFTKPIFNAQKNIALIGYYNGTNSRLYSGNKFCLLILKREKMKWNFWGYEIDIGEQN